MTKAKLSLICVTSIVFLHCSVFAQGSNDFTLEYAGSAIWTHFTDLIVDGHHLYVALINGFKVLDIRDPSNPKQLSQTYLDGRQTYALALEQPYLYVRVRDGLLVFDISNPRKPVLVGEYDVTCLAGNMVVSDHYVYIFCDTHLEILDVSRPSEPLPVGSLPIAQNRVPGVVTVSGEIAYIGAGYFYVIDISVPSNPQLLSTFNTPYSAFGLVQRDSLIYIADHAGYYPAMRSGFTILDVSDPTAPWLLASHEVLGDVRLLALDNDYAFISAGMSGLVVFDIADPRVPKITGCYDTPSGTGPIAVSGDYVILTDNLLFTDEEHPYKNCSPDSTGIGGGSLSQSGDLQFIDVTDKSSPVLAGSFPTGGWLMHLAVSRTHAYVTDQNGDLIVLDITNPDTLVRVSTVQLPGPAGKMSVHGSHLYVPDGVHGLLIMSISDPDNPVVVGSVDTPGGAEAVDVQGHYAFLAGGNYGLVIIDVTNPCSPVLIASAPAQDMIMDVIVRGQYAYLADRYAGLQIVDISDPSRPTQTARFEGMIYTSLALQDSVIYVDGTGTFAAIDVSDPFNPTLLGFHWPVIAAVWDLTIIGDYLCVAAADRGVMAFNISDPANMYLVDQVPTPGYAWSIDALQDNIFLVDMYSVIRYRTSLQGIDHGRPESFELHQNYPNPFNASTSISYRLPHSSHVTLEVLNIVGQRVKILVDRFETEGDHVIMWNASEYASGIYLYRLTSGSHSSTRKMLLLK